MTKINAAKAEAAIMRFECAAGNFGEMGMALMRTQFGRMPVGLAAMCFALLAGTVLAQSRDDNIRKCQSADPNLRIVACTALIQSGKETTAAMASAFAYRGGAYALKQQYDRAIQDFDQAIRLDPNSLDALIGRGFAYGAKRQYDRAIRDFDRVVRLKPNAPKGFFNRGTIYWQNGQYDHAIQDFDQAINLNPHYVDAFIGRGLAYYDKGQYDRAIKDYDQAIQLSANNAYAYMFRAEARLKNGDTLGAKADFAKARQLNPDIGR